MKYVNGYVCTICHRQFPADFTGMTCSHCGESGILDVTYDYQSMRQEVTRDYFRNHTDYSIWRYLPLLSVKENRTNDSLRVGWTPLYRSRQIGPQLGHPHLYFKDDGQNPTQSLKDRASLIAVCKAIEAGNPVVACASTGNAASSLAGNAARMGLQSVIFVPKRAPKGKLAQLKAFGSTLVVVDGDYKDAFRLSKEAIEAFGYYNRNAAINPHLVEGKKTVALEIAEQLDFEVPDWVVVSVGDGCTIGGVYKGFYDLFQLGIITKIPRILGVQSTGCDPFVEAFEHHEALRETEENTIADSIAVGIPRNPIKAMNAVCNSLGAFIAVEDREILSGIATLGKSEGIFAEPAAAASFAGYLKAFSTGILQATDRVVVIVTGNGLKDTKNALAAFEEQRLVKPNLEDLQKYLSETER